MTRWTRLRAAGVLSSFLLIACSSAAEPGECPETIAVQQQLAEAIPGWTSALDEMPHRLASITFFDGPPEQKASLVNDETTKSRGKEMATWHFGAQAARQIWQACGYAATDIVLKRALTLSTKTCSVTYDPRKLVAGLPLIEKISCK